MGKRTTTIREYDEQGRLVRETVLEEIIGAPADVVPLVQPARPIVFPSPPRPEVTWTACTCPLAGCPLHPTGWPGRLPQTAGFHLEINAGAADNYSRSHEAAGPTWRGNNAGVYP